MSIGTRPLQTRPGAEELSDATWYFLRSTDFAVKTVPDGVQLSPPGGGPKSDGSAAFVEVLLKEASPGSFQVRGWIRESFLSSQSRPLWLELRIAPLRTKRDFPRVTELIDATKRREVIDLQSFADEEGVTAMQSFGRGDDERYLLGEWKATLDHRRLICKLMLESL